jgi:succinate dehydrogenase/fumarate reductase flavoprotein subunit
VKIGPGKGYEWPKMDTPRPVARWTVKSTDEIHYETDVLVIGGGGAGTAAALIAQEQGARAIIATKLRHGDANTMMAEGGIQAATKGWKDSPYYHYLDVMGGGHFERPSLVKTMVTEAPKLLAGWNGSAACLTNGRRWLFTLHGAGTCRKRMHYAGDMTGGDHENSSWR